MRDVYQKANSTIIRLGELKDADDPPVLADLISILQSNTMLEEEIGPRIPAMKERYSLIQDITKLHRQQVLEDHDKWFMGEHVHASTDPECTPTQARRHLEVARLFARAWIVQEVLTGDVAKPGCLVRSNEYPIRHAGPIRLCCATCHPRYRWIATSAAHQDTRIPCFLDVDSCEKAVRTRRVSSKAFSFFFVRNPGEFYFEEFSKSFSSKSFTSKSFTSTNSRHKIFTLLGLKKNLERELV